MAASKPRDIKDDFAEYVKPDLQRQQDELIEKLTRLTKTHPSKSLREIQRAVTSTARGVGVQLKSATVEKVASRIKLVEKA